MGSRNEGALVLPVHAIVKTINETIASREQHEKSTKMSNTSTLPAVHEGRCMRSVGPMNCYLHQVDDEPSRKRA
jgi:hypothetical protein